MKKYIVKYTYNHGFIESEMKVEAESLEEAKEKAFQYAGVDHVISAKEIDFSEEAKKLCNAIRALAENPERLENLESYLSYHFENWCKKYANNPENMTGEFEQFAGI